MFEGRDAWAEIDLDAIAHNTQALKGWVGQRTHLLAIVKANGYGHGALPVARTALENGATWLGVNFSNEGVQLRQVGITAPILLVGHTPLGQAHEVVANRLTPTVNDPALADALNTAAAQQGIVQPVHVKVDTGLTRYGVLPDEVAPLVRHIASLPHLRCEGLFTHFASADAADKSSVLRQLDVYHDTVHRLEQEGIAVPIKHVAASGAVLDLRQTHLDMVRCGITIYGCYPSDEVSHEIGLRPALSLKGRIARLRTIPAGAGVGYGATFVTTHSTRAALAPIGYADGIRRPYSNRGSVLVRGKRAPVLGRVSMDQMTVDVSDIPEAVEGDEVVLIGRQGNDEISAEEMAGIMGTINYEVLVGISARVPRVYLRGGREVGYTTLTENTVHFDTARY